MGEEGEAVTKNEVLERKGEGEEKEKRREERENKPKAAVRDGMPRVCTGHRLETPGPTAPS